MPLFAWSNATHLSIKQAVLSYWSSTGSRISQSGDFSTDGGLSWIWYLVPVYVSFLLPKALLKHSSLEHSNHITASIPLGIKVFGGIGFSVGFTKSYAFLFSISRSVGSKSAGIWYPDRAFSKSIA